MVEGLIEVFKRATEVEQELEVLNGWPGYLFCLLSVYQVLPDYRLADLT